MKQKPAINNVIHTFGIGKNTVGKIFRKSGLNITKNLKNLNQRQQLEVNKNLKNLQVGKKLKSSQKQTLDFLFRIKTYRGVRHKLKYPARGQRTHTNAKTKQKFKL